MKHIILVVFCILSLFAISYGAELGPSPEKTADALITTGIGQYGGMVVITDATNNCTVKVYDNTVASGRVLDDGICVGATVTCKYLFPWPIPFDRGVYADITSGGTCTYIIYYK
jgi:hypothetical protein